MTTPHKLVIGIVGAIGAGKSAAAAAFARRGGAVVDADRLGHAVLERPDVKNELVTRWGTEVIKPDGTANRRAVAAIVFNSPAERRVLEGVVFPHIRRMAVEAVETARADPAARFVVLDAAVMLEAGWNGACDRIVYVDAARPVRLARLAERNGWGEDEVTAREAAQLPAAEKRATADAVVINDGTRDGLQEQVDRLLTLWDL
ncbi:dephospho-CoA kinase [Fimbriiglobus ruber]|uniref:Dephospho-CoA kinase n=1 Tax=Fimbriiglobus ruber TaxID=1908690 RepID=A0A225E4N4_9BACT|nr:dephospho-CoA kinase [Fimbriiglobus ruber]OWK43645.1 Dephospho-CoA kinase [Fimbriiglobus ruber]